MITTVAGDGASGYSGDGGPAQSARFSLALGLAFDGNGNLYIADQFRLRKVSRDGTITTVAGNGVSYYGGDNGPVAGAQLGIHCCYLAGGVVAAPRRHFVSRGLMEQPCPQGLAGRHHHRGGR